MPINNLFVASRSSAPCHRASWAASISRADLTLSPRILPRTRKPNLRKYIDGAWKQLTPDWTFAGCITRSPELSKDMKEALSRADFVQENGPERPDFKDQVVRRYGRGHAAGFAHRLELIRDHDQKPAKLR